MTICKSTIQNLWGFIASHGFSVAGRPLSAATQQAPDHSASLDLGAECAAQLPALRTRMTPSLLHLAPSYSKAVAGMASGFCIAAFGVRKTEHALFVTP